MLANQTSEIRLIGRDERIFKFTFLGITFMKYRRFTLPDVHKPIFVPFFPCFVIVAEPLPYEPRVPR